MAVLRIDLSGRNGLAPFHFGSPWKLQSEPNLRYIGKQGQMAEGMWNPFRRHGYLSPATDGALAVDDGGGTFSSLLTASAYDAILDDQFWIEKTAEFYEGDGLDDLALTNTFDIANGTLTDLEIYQVNGTRKLFIIYKNGSGNMDIVLSSLPTGTEDASWLTSTVSGSFTNAALGNPFMRTADNGLAYIFQDAYVHVLDGTTGGGANGTVRANQLTFPPFFQLTDAVDHRGNLYIALLQRTTDIFATDAQKIFSSPCGVYVWDRQSTQVRMRDYIPVYGVKEIRKIYVGPKGDLRIIVITANRTVQIMRLNGSVFEVLEELGIGAYPNVHDSLQVVGLGTYWIANDGYFYFHGQVSPSDPEGVFRINRVRAATANGSDPSQNIVGGAILFGGGTGVAAYPSETFYVGYIDNNAGGAATYHLKKIYINGSGTLSGTTQNGFSGDVYSLVSYLPKLSKVDNIRIFMAPISSTGSTVQGTVSIYFNQSTTAFKSQSVTRDDCARGYISIPINKPWVNSVQIKVAFATGVALASTDFSPSFAEVEYSNSLNVQSPTVPGK